MTVKMTRSEPMHDGGPTTAKVHPAEVENWRKCGWVEAVEADPLDVAEETQPEPIAEPLPTRGKPGRKPKHA